MLLVYKFSNDDFMLNDLELCSICLPSFLVLYHLNILLKTLHETTQLRKLLAGKCSSCTCTCMVHGDLFPESSFGFTHNVFLKTRDESFCLLALHMFICLCGCLPLAFMILSCNLYVP